MLIRVADLTIEISPQHELLASRLLPYAADCDACEADGESPCVPASACTKGLSVASHTADFSVTVKPSYIAQKRAQMPGLKDAEWEYLLTGEAFYNKLLTHDGFMLHASAVEYDGQAYLFSAPSGTGKSTHTHLWLEHFGDRARIINDDKPAIILRDGIFYACGTPWSGKTDESLNKAVPIAGIAFLERAIKNSITPLSPVKALTQIMNQTVRPADSAKMDKLLSLLDCFLSNNKVYLLKCNMSHEAVINAYNSMKGDNHEDK